jgi:hypothetical protein
MCVDWLLYDLAIVIVLNKVGVGLDSSRFYFTQTADKLEKPDTDSFMKLHLICLLLDSCFYHAFAIETNWYKI